MGSLLPLLGPGGMKAASVRDVWNAVKITMVPRQLSLEDRFLMARDAGFDGVSLLYPAEGLNPKVAMNASSRSGLPVHNVNNSRHWTTRLSAPDESVRRQSRESVEDTIRFASDVGASSILLVVGKVTDPAHENHDQVWSRSSENIRKMIPLAARLGVRILCENVGNGFCETPESWAAFLDQFNSPWVGAFYDLGNHHSKGGADRWIRVLRSRIVKVDLKGHSSVLGKNCNLFDGDIPWETVRKELSQIGFAGWATAEVKGGDLPRLKEVVRRMNRAMKG